ncbi:ABC transporter permease [Herbivorax sp. ANBcel31]|uniref:ABC transporter permease n=1 Tax=Herbivorax sp. ANBcel31 TaxID=3069754 RepID=UPI0027B32D16|nr:ABC transporter permease [Herbivorax sp. ANBcel31]MDQ2085036.1 ABC transporter permease [Herbivorax sp. ANBcel31]
MLSKRIVKFFYKNTALLIFIVVIHFIQLIYSRNAYDNFVGDYKGALSGLCQMIILDDYDKINSLNFYGASILVQLIFTCGVIVASFIASDKENHTLSRILMSPIRKIQILAGYLTGFVFSIMIVSIVYIVISSKLLEVFWGYSIFNLLFVTFICVLSSVSLAMLISTFVHNTKLAAGIMSILIILMTFLSGSTSATLQYSKTSSFTLFKWAFESYLNNMDGKVLKESFGNIYVLLISSLIFLTLSILFFRRKSIYDN